MKRYKRNTLVDGHPIVDLVQEIVLHKDDITKRLNDQCDEISELIASNERLVKECAELVKYIEQQCRETEVLMTQLTSSTDQNDLLLDEVVRIKHLTDNEEIHALCERARLRMRQNVSVIDRNMMLEQKVFSLKRDMKALQQENDKLAHNVSVCQKFMASYICYTPDELAEVERRRILKVAYELIRAFPHHTGVYHWLLEYADELVKPKQEK